MVIDTEYEQALTLIRRLDRPMQSRLIAQVVQELATDSSTASTQMTDSRAILAELHTHFATLGTTTPSAAEQLERDCNERTAALEGTLRASVRYTPSHTLIIGGGIGGLASAIAATHVLRFTHYVLQLQSHVFTSLLHLKARCHRCVVRDWISTASHRVIVD